MSTPKGLVIQLCKTQLESGGGLTIVLQLSAIASRLLEAAATQHDWTWVMVLGSVPVH